jgi:hypothetical protein
LVDCSGSKIKSYLFRLNKRDPHVGQLALEFSMYRSSDGNSWRMARTHRRVPLPNRAGNFSYPITAYLAWSLFAKGPIGWATAIGRAYEESRGSTEFVAGSPIDGTFGTGFVVFMARIVRDSPVPNGGDASVVLYVDQARFSEASGSAELDVRAETLQEARIRYQESAKTQSSLFSQHEESYE